MLVEKEKLFYTPLWTFKYDRFNDEEQSLVSYLKSDDLYLRDREKNGLQITEANLHKHRKLFNITSFIRSCFNYCMEDLGYVQDNCITSMWATRHRHGGFHHLHNHANSFLAGVFHIYDETNSADGTVLIDPSTKFALEPAVQDVTKLLSNTRYTNFVPGTFIVFPASTMHYTLPNNSTYRIVIAVNSMPLGMTNKDHFDRYNFPDVEDLPLKEYNKNI